MNKDSKPVDIIEQYVQEGNIEKLREILDMSKKKVEELKSAIAKVEEVKLLEAYRSGDKEYIQKILQEMDGGKVKRNLELDVEESEKEKEPDGYSKY